MSNWLDKAKSGGSSFEGVITNYTFMDEFPFAEGERNESDGDYIYMLLEVTKDGAGDPEKRALWFGSGMYLTIKEKGKVLVASEEGNTPHIYEDGEVCEFLQGLDDAGFPFDTRVPSIEDTKTIDLRGILGTRIRVAFVQDKERQLVVGKAKLGAKAKTATEEQLLEAGKRLAKKGKYKGKKFNLTKWVVSRVLDVPDAQAGAGRTNGKVRTKPAEDTDEGESDNDEAPSISAKKADKFLAGLLGATKGNTLKKADLALAITRYGTRTLELDGPEVNAYRVLINDEDYLSEAAERGVIAWNAKKQTVTAAEESD